MNTPEDLAIARAVLDWVDDATLSQISGMAATVSGRDGEFRLYLNAALHSLAIVPADEVDMTTEAIMTFARERSANG